MFAIFIFVITTARCFYGYYLKIRPASDFKIAVNKMYRKYNDTRDRNTQYSDVDDIIIPSSFRGYVTDLEDDIAIVVVKRPFFLHLSVQPVCLDFDNDLDNTQLADGNSGKTVVWSDVVNSDQWSDVLDVVDILYMKNENCNTIFPINFREHVTEDKFCARRNFGNGLIYYGSGLALLESTTQRYYLREVSSECLTYSYVYHDFIFSITSIMKHANFIKQHL